MSKIRPLRAATRRPPPQKPKVYESEGHRLHALYYDVINLDRSTMVSVRWANLTAVGKARWRVLAHEFGREYSVKKEATDKS